VYVRSTTIDRTLMSAYSQMAGLFPAGTASIQDVGSRYGLKESSENETGLPLRWQPVPIHSESISTDALLLPGNNCPRFGEIRKELRKASAFVERSEAEKNLLSKLAGIVGLDKVTLTDAWAINDIWVCNEAHGVPLPADVTPSIRKSLQDLSDWLLLYGNQGLETHRLSAGLLLHEIKTRLELSKQAAEPSGNSKQASPPSKKFVLYSAHDSTVAATLSALNIEYTTNPRYNSTLIWELSQDSNNGAFYVQVEYNGRARRVPGCGLPTTGDSSCTLGDYVQATRAVTVPGTRAREIECMVGIQRKLAGFASWFTKTPKDIVDGGTQQPPERPVRSQSSVPFYFFVLAVGCIAGAFIMRAKTSLDGYFLTKADDPDSDPTAPIRRLVKRSERGILL
jgi:Histidine phosphatase superfamily (branch 2)